MHRHFGKTQRKTQEFTNGRYFDAVDAARWFGFIILSLLALSCFAEELGNPLEREFFGERKIRQVSTNSVWDNPQPTDNVPDWRQSVQPQTQPVLPETQFPSHYPYPVLPQMPQQPNYYNPAAYAQAEPPGMYAMNPYLAYDSYSVQPWIQSYEPDAMNPAFPPDQQQTMMQLLLQQEYQRHLQSLAQEEGEPAAVLPDKMKKEKESGKKEEQNYFGYENLMPLKVSSPLGSTLLSCAKTLSPFATPTGPHKGVGQPMETRSWLDHPYYVGGFVGRISGSELVSTLIDQNSGGHGGLIFGYYLNDYWGVESRLHLSSIDIKETAAGAAAYQEWYAAMSEGNDTAGYVPKLTTRSNQISVLDASVHYYPLGNTKWRPFFKYGLGFARESFTNTYGQKIRINTVAMPFGAGLRYWWNENLAIQADLVDNVIFSSKGTKTQGNIAFAVGLTYSFGTSKSKRPTVYWPYTPSRGSKW
ncbi:MAG: outer membrane beta-barrel protein [Planctomycetaceae bacterium]|nr:outer membrane beta-barrel protein [Planctomycetaceae bacterium]